MKKILFAAALFIISFQSSFGQGSNPVIGNLTAKLKTLLTEHITEKAYLHFDRPYNYYVAGEIIYFKAYVTMGEWHEPSKISGILHVDLINQSNILLQSIKLQLANGVGVGDFTLPDTLKKGSYRVRAYTEWMRNEKEPNFFEQHISVSSANSVYSTEAVNTSGHPALQFFPEGGNLVTDIKSRVAFKAIGPDGLGIDVKGTIVDHNNKEVAKLVSEHLGMGVFDLIPEPGEKYSAKVIYADHSQSTVNLPAVEEKGMTLSVNTANPDKVSIEINANRTYYKANLNKELNILIYGAGAMRTITTKLDNAILGLNLSAKDFSSGIVTVTLMSQTGEPLNERMVFIQNPDLLNLSLNSIKPIYQKRENVQLGLNAKNKDGNVVNGFFSISVVDESKISVDENSENSILSYLLLTSDVKGYVEKPNYYFSNLTKETRTNLDVLMLTQGFRRFVWRQLLNENLAQAAFKPERNSNISGVLKSKDGVPLANSKVNLMQKATNTILTQVTDANGRFNFENVAYYSGSSFLLTSKASGGKHAPVLTLDIPAQGPFINNSDVVDAKYNANANILASLQNNRQAGVVTASYQVNGLLKEDKVIGVKNNNNYRSSNIGGPGHADQVIGRKDIKNTTSLSIGLNGIARGVDFVDGVPYLKNSWVASSGSAIREPMLVMVDGNTNSTVDNIDPSAVETVEILKGNSGAIYGVRGGMGVIVITTRQGEATYTPVTKEMSPGIFSITPQGLYKAREFYLPSYNAAQPTNKLSDNRTTIFWSPDVMTDAYGNASFNFYNADGAGTYRVEVQGIDAKGNLGRQVFSYKVE